jgi:uncharacterized repeat protein (TIGR03803 family)
MDWRRLTLALALAAGLAAAMTTTLAQAQNYKFKVLHTFHGANGAAPASYLVRDASGNIYGTASVGGDASGRCAFFGGCGTAFKLDKTGKQVWLHRFAFSNGMQPLASLTLDSAGNLYGTTYLGGDTKCYEYGCGTAFKLDSAGRVETVLHKFTGGTDGLDPEPLLARDAAGNLYGTAGPIGNIFKIDTTGKLTVLYQFTGGSDGCFPAYGVILDAAGNLYGSAAQGGIAFCNSGYGTVFELDTTGKLTVLHTFDVSDGAYPGPLVFDPAGNLYGPTGAGGDNYECGSTGCGTVFELSPQDSGWVESTLYSFCSLSGCADGRGPGGPLARDSAGNLYGIAGGGKSRCWGSGCGVVFKLDSAGKETVLYSFTGGADGAYPSWGVTEDKAGNLYGTTFFGGDLGCMQGNGDGCGVVFKLTP